MAGRGWTPAVHPRPVIILSRFPSDHGRALTEPAPVRNPMEPF
jgi:hypothetical protein